LGLISRPSAKILSLAQHPDLYNEIVNTLIDDIDKDKVNSFVSELCNLLIDSAKTTFGTHKYKTRPDTCNKKPMGDRSTLVQL
jgi:hypothetical protein